MPGILDSSAPTPVSEPRLKLANCLWEVTSPQTILAASSLGSTERLQRLLGRHRALLSSLDLLEALEAVVTSQSLAARFMLIHSSLEFLLTQLDQDRDRQREDREYLEERVKLICLAPFGVSRVPFTMAFRKRFLLKPVPISYTNLILDLREFALDEFLVTLSNDAGRVPADWSSPEFIWDESVCLLRPVAWQATFLLRNPADYFVYSTNNITDSEEFLSEDSPSYEIEYRGERFEEIAEMIELAEAYIEAYDPRLLKELRFFVRAFAMDTAREGEGKVFYSSLRWQPGLVQMTPYLLGKREGMKIEKTSDPVVMMLVAAQIIHEGLHQKHFYLNSCEDTNPISEGPCGLTRPQSRQAQITCTWGERRGLNDFFNLAVSLGSEIMFLEHLLRTQRLRSEEQDFFKRRLKRKRSYLIPLLVQAELLRHHFSPGGEIVLGELFRLFRYQTT